MSRFLMEPGPTQVDTRVLQALAEPVVYHQSPEFVEIMDLVCEQLQRIFQTSGEIVVIPSTGRGGIEASLNSVREPGQAIVIPVNGSFARMVANFARGLGLNVVELPFAPGEEFSRVAIEEALAKHDRPILGMVHNETSTAMVNDLSGYGAFVHSLDGLFLVDTVSSLGGASIETDALEIDLCVSASQKAVGALAGLSFVAVSARASDRIHSRAAIDRALYFDLRRWWDMWLPSERGGKLTSGYRRLPWTMATNLVVALKRANELMFEEGLNERWARHERAGIALRSALAELGMKPVAAAGRESATVTAVYGTSGLKVDEVRKALAERHGIGIAGGMDDLGGKIFRIGHMAETARPSAQAYFIAALAHELGERGAPVADPMKALMAAWGTTA